MSFFTVVGMIVTSIVVLLIATFIGMLIWNFFEYQKGARLTRDYAYSGPDRGEWFWTIYGAKTWIASFKHGGGWSRTVADPDDDNYDLTIYENGKMVREPTRYPG